MAIDIDKYAEFFLLSWTLTQQPTQATDPFMLD